MTHMPDTGVVPAWDQCATELHDDTHDLRAVQRLLGHASVATTERYVAVRDETVRRMVAERSRRWAS